MKLEAFKQGVQKNKTKRHEDFQERCSMFLALSQQLMSLSEDQKEAVRKCFNKQQDAYLRESRKQVTILDFERIQVIGRGAFGVVWLCRKRVTGEIFAMKQMNKNEMVCKNQIHHVRAERDVLSKASDQWVIGLHDTFQDDQYLYMVMDYLPGGDLMTHLIRKEYFSEDEARFYLAELVEAVDYIHTELHYIHRDLKPDNIVLDSEGHIHLLDFGLCKHTPSTAKEADSAVPSEGAPRAGEPKHPSRAHLQSVVGTPDYRGPEVYGQEPYGKECDWWSVGCILFEMLCGGPPFSDDDHDARVTEARVQRWWEHYRIPDDVVVSPDAEDLLRKLICDPKDRLGADQIRVHPFFQGIDFAKLRQMTPPIRPVVTGPTDTSNFDDFGQENARYPLSDARHHIFKDPSLFAFHDYSFRRDLASKKPSVIAALKSVG